MQKGLRVSSCNKLLFFTETLLIIFCLIDSKDEDTLSLCSKPTGPTGITPATFESPTALPAESDTPLSLKQNRLLSDAILSALEAFWSASWGDPARSHLASLELEMDAQAQFTPPIWFIYHLAGHPCCRFRECVS
uniref:Uncharacterized protein n=1 Tax=Schistocephalus solidus TaxID=70667 RepID=A0A0X3QEA6_SCHSO